MFTFYWENKFLIGQIFLFFSVLNWFWGVEKQTNKYYILNIRDSKFQLWHITKSTLLLHRTLQSMTKTPMPKSYMHGFFWPSLKSKEELRFISYPGMLLHNRSSKLKMLSFEKGAKLYYSLQCFIQISNLGAKRHFNWPTKETLGNVHKWCPILG